MPGSIGLDPAAVRLRGAFHYEVDGKVGECRCGDGCATI
jgi:hypothetical protein